MRLNEIGMHYVFYGAFSGFSCVILPIFIVPGMIYYPSRIKKATHFGKSSISRFAWILPFIKTHWFWGVRFAGCFIDVRSGTLN
jgi:hypothetical protein